MRVFRKKKFIIGGIIIFLAVGYLAYVGYTSSASYYYTVSEFVAKEDSIRDASVRVNGQVVTDSIEREDGGLKLSFTVTEGGEDLQVVYEGVVPDAFADNVDVVVEGRLNPDGVFMADSILTKCPSKYVPE